MTRRRVDDAESRRASRGWWDTDADDYQAEHGAFLGDVDFVWCPEGLREADARLLGDVAGAAGAGGRLRRRGRRPLAGHPGRRGRSRWTCPPACCATPRAAADRTGVRVPLVQADALALPFADAAFDVVCTAFGAVPFVDDSAAVMREVFRVLRPGGRWVFSVTHPMRWIFLDDPGEGGLVAVHSYFDRRPYVEQDEHGAATYVEHHRTLGDRVRELVGAGLPPASTWSSRSGRRATRGSGASGARCAAGSSPAPPSSSPRSPPAERRTPGATDPTAPAVRSPR